MPVRTDTARVPSSYAELHEHYRPYVVRLLGRLGFPNVEDTSSVILMKFFEKGGLEQFDPNRGVRFGTFLSNFVIPYARSERERAERFRSMELQVVSITSSEEDDRPFLDSIGYAHEDDYGDVEEEALAAVIRARLILAGDDKLLTLFDLIREKTKVGNKVVAYQLAEDLGVSKPTMLKRMGKLRLLVDELR